MCQFYSDSSQLYYHVGMIQIISVITLNCHEDLPCKLNRIVHSSYSSISLFHHTIHYESSTIPQAT
jgi:hypothetical protein